MHSDDDVDFCDSFMKKHLGHQCLHQD